MSGVANAENSKHLMDDDEHRSVRFLVEEGFERILLYARPAAVSDVISRNDMSDKSTVRFYGGNVVGYFSK